MPALALNSLGGHSSRDIDDKIIGVTDPSWSLNSLDGHSSRDVGPFPDCQWWTERLNSLGGHSSRAKTMELQSVVNAQLNAAQFP